MDTFRIKIMLLAYLCLHYEELIIILLLLEQFNECAKLHQVFDYN